MCYHKITYYIMSAVTAFALASGLTSCGNEDEVLDDMATTDGQCQVEFYIDFNGGNSTRSIDWDYLPEEEGTANENYIDINSLKIFLFKNGFPAEPNWSTGRWGTQQCNVKWSEMFTSQEMKFKPTLVTSSSNGAYVKGILTGTWIDKGTTDFKMLVEANYYGNSAAETASNRDNEMYSNLYMGSVIGKDNFTFTEGYIPTAENPIPMSGLITCSNLDLRKGYSCYLGSIPMIRALAKIEVFPGNDNISLSDVQLLRCHDKGLVNPLYAKQDGSQLSTLTVPTPDNLNVAGEGSENCGNPTILGQKADGTGTPLPFIAHKDENDNVDYYVIYLPEYRITGDRLINRGNSYGLAADPDNCIKLKCNGREGTVWFRDYSQDVEVENCPSINIIRNHIYRYYIEGFSAAKLMVNYVVEPWTEQTAGDITFD